MKSILAVVAVWGVGMVTTGCIEHRVKAEPIEVKPIHITVDVNLRVDKQLEDFFDFEKGVEPKQPQPK